MCYEDHRFTLFGYCEKLGIRVFFIHAYEKIYLASCQLLGYIVFSIQLYLLGAYTGSIGLMINILRNLLLLKINDWQWVKSKRTLSAILILLLAMTVYTWAGWISLLPLASVGITTITLVSIIFSIYRFGWTNMGEGQIK